MDDVVGHVTWTLLAGKEGYKDQIELKINTRKKKKKELKKEGKWRGRERMSGILSTNPIETRDTISDSNPNLFSFSFSYLYIFLGDKNLLLLHVRNHLRASV